MGACKIFGCMYCKIFGVVVKFGGLHGVKFGGCCKQAYIVVNVGGGVFSLEVGLWSTSL